MRRARPAAPRSLALARSPLARARLLALARSRSLAPRSLALARRSLALARSLPARSCSRARCRSLPLAHSIARSTRSLAISCILPLALARTFARSAPERAALLIMLRRSLVLCRLASRVSSQTGAEATLAAIGAAKTAPPSTGAATGVWPAPEPISYPSAPLSYWSVSHASVSSVAHRRLWGPSRLESSRNAAPSQGAHSNLLLAREECRRG